MDEIKKADANYADVVYLLDKQIFGYESYSQISIQQELSNPTRIYFVYYMQNQPVGFVGCSKILSTCDIIKIGVLNNFRGKQIASKLLQHLINFLKHMRAECIMLEVKSSNVFAKKLYEKHFFTLINTRHSYYKNGEDALIYKLILK